MHLVQTWAGAVPVGAMHWHAQCPTSDITRAQAQSRAKLLEYIRRNPGCSAADIALSLCRPTGSITGRLSEYVKLGLINRTGKMRAYSYRVVP